MLKNQRLGIRSLALFTALVCAGFLPLTAFSQAITRLTFNTGPDINPAWDPRGATIAYVRPKVAQGSVFDAYAVSSSAQGGEQVLLSGANADFGVAVACSWIGSTGFLAVEEAISGFEALRFNTAFAPFTRAAANGSDTANDLLLSINGGGGGGILKISRDGNVALVRFSTSGSAGAITIRSGAVSSMTGQAYSTFGAILTSVTAGDGRFLNGAALSPDGSRFVLAIPTSTSTTPHDLFIANTASGAQSTNLTNSAASGVFNITPDFSPDGTKIAFARWSGNSSETYDIYVMNVNGSGLTQVTNTPNFTETYPSWAPDGNSIAFMGVHVTGHETEFPALLPGEAINHNIYLLTLPATNTVTPKTSLTEPPLVQIDGRKVTFTLAPFAKAQKTAITKSLDLDAGTSNLRSTILRAKKAKFSFKYELRVNNIDKKKQRYQRVSSRNTITIKNLPPGNYSSMYRVQIFKKQGGKTTKAGNTKFSPRANFTVE